MYQAREAIEILRTNNPCKIVVVGDLMLDRYTYGSVQRLSPEYPAPVLNVQSEKCLPGGAANVAVNLHALGNQVVIGGFIGHDNNGKTLKRLLTSLGIDCSGIYKYERQTTIKNRIYDGTRQLMRIDHEETSEIEVRDQSKLINWIADCLQQTGVKALIISDYGKGVCTPKVVKEIIGIAINHKLPVIVDPKGQNWEKYTGAYCITPNRNELQAVLSGVSLGDTAFTEQVNHLRRSLNIANVLVTLSEQGMQLINDELTLHLPAVSSHVVDVTGAGDMVVAAVTSLIARGSSLIDAVKIANLAAGLAVKKSDSRTVSISELLVALLSGVEEDNKVFRLDELLLKIQEWRRQHERIIFTNGCFDLLHAGHIRLLKKAKALGDRLIVGLNSDKSVSINKGLTRPINGENERAELLSALKMVDAVVIFDSKTPLELVRQIRPDVIVKGGDYTVNEVVGRQYAKNVEIVEYESGYSTTRIINKITRSNVTFMEAGQ